MEEGNVEEEFKRLNDITCSHIEVLQVGGTTDLIIYENALLIDNDSNLFAEFVKKIKSLGLASIFFGLLTQQDNNGEEEFINVYLKCGDNDVENQKKCGIILNINSLSLSEAVMMFTKTTTLPNVRFFYDKRKRSELHHLLNKVTDIRQLCPLSVS